MPVYKEIIQKIEGDRSTNFGFRIQVTRLEPGKSYFMYGRVFSAVDRRFRVTVTEDDTLHILQHVPTGQGKHRQFKPMKSIFRGSRINSIELSGYSMPPRSTPAIDELGHIKATLRWRDND